MSYQSPIEKSSKKAYRLINQLKLTRDVLNKAPSRAFAKIMVDQLNETLHHFYTHRSEWSTWQAILLTCAEPDCDKAMARAGLGYTIEFQNHTHTDDEWLFFAYSTTINTYHKLRRQHPVGYGFDTVTVRIQLD